MFAEHILIEWAVDRSAVIGLPGAAVTHGLAAKSALNNTTTSLCSRSSSETGL